jgi:hypothetical protein
MSQASTSLSEFAQVSGEAGDLAGYSVSSSGDVNGDGYDDFIVSTYGNDDGGTDAGAVHLIYGSAEAFTGAQSVADAAQFTGKAATDYTGRAVSGAGDVNGDGYDDFIIGAEGNDDGGSYAGIVYLIYGSATEYTGTQSLGDFAAFTGEATSDAVGVFISLAGDVNADGFDDFIIGALHTDDAGSNSGSIYLVYGSATEYTGTQSLGDFAAFTGEAANDNAAQVAFAGDVNGDGYDDFLVGAIGNDDGASNAGSAYLIYGSATEYTGTQGLSAFVEFTGTAVDAGAGKVGRGGDFNGDGYDDFLVGEYVNNVSTGAAYVLYGSATEYTGTQSLGDFAQFIGEVEEDRAGYASSSVGDVNGDGYDDFLISADQDDTIGDAAGAAYLIYGSSILYTGTQSLSDFIKFTGEASNDRAGFALGFGGDINADGFDEILIGAYTNSNGGSAGGTVYVGYLYRDNDEDGVAGAVGLFEGEDCDDSDAAISEEQSYYTDADGDGLGVSSATLLCSLTAPAGYVTDSTDLNDNDFDNDGVETENDCDDSDAAVSEEQTYYADADGDGFGDAAVTTAVCSLSAPTGFVVDDSDCSDADAAVSEEQTYYADADGDGFGDVATSESFCAAEANEGYVVNSSDDDDTTFGDIDNVVVNDDGTLTITYTNTATQTVDPFTATNAQVRTAMSADLRRVIVTNGKTIKVYRDGVLQTSKKVNKKKPAYNRTRLRVTEFYSNYDTIVFASARKKSGKLVVFRLNDDDELKKKVVRTTALERRAHAPVRLRFTSATHRVRVQFDSGSHRVRASYKLTPKGRLKLP